MKYILKYQYFQPLCRYDMKGDFLSDEKKRQMLFLKLYIYLLISCQYRSSLCISQVAHGTQGIALVSRFFTTNYHPFYQAMVQ